MIFSRPQHSGDVACFSWFANLFVAQVGEAVLWRCGIRGGRGRGGRGCCGCLGRFVVSVEEVGGIAEIAEGVGLRNIR